MGGCKPRSKEQGIFSTCLPEGFELPGAIVEVVEIVASLYGDSTNFSDNFCSLHAATHRTRIDCARLPMGSNAFGDSSGFRASLSGEFKWLAPPKSFGFDALNVPMANEQNFGHVRSDGRSLREA
jgi:hypothetical protein